MKKTSKRALFVGLLLALLGVAWAVLQGQKSQNKTTYVTSTVDRATIEQSVSASGTINPVKLVNVGTQVSGVIRILHVDFNDVVKEGQVLAELDPSLLQSQLEQSKGNLVGAEATLKQTSANYKRVQSLHAKDYVASADLDLAREQMETAQARVAIAKAQMSKDMVNIGYSVIKSPVSGVIISRNVDVGQTVAASFQTPTLFVIAQDLKKMQIDTNLSEADVGNVKPDIGVRFTVDAFAGRQFAGGVRQVRLNPTTVQNVVTYNVVIDVDNEDLTLLPGMTAFVKLIEAEKTDVLRIPNAALDYRPKEETEPCPKDSKCVYTLKNKKPQRMVIQTGISDGKFTELLGNTLQEGDAVITEESVSESKAKGKGAIPRGPRLF